MLQNSALGTMSPGSSRTHGGSLITFPKFVMLTVVPLELQILDLKIPRYLGVEPREGRAWGGVNLSGI